MNNSNGKVNRIMMRENIEEVERKIQKACERSGRNRSDVTLIAVSKTKPNEMLVQAYALGMRHFGENKVQELDKKFADLDSQFDEKVNWHMIGHLQRNKVKYIIDKAILIHSVDSLRLAEQIEEEAAKKGIVSDILIEVNVAGEDSKFGVGIDEVKPLLEAIATLAHVRVRGLMTIAPYVKDSEKNRKYFKILRELYVDIKTKNNDNNCKGSTFDIAFFDTLSMGMTGDYEVAIEEGATMVRIGTGIFGERDYSKTV